MAKSKRGSIVGKPHKPIRAAVARADEDDGDDDGVDEEDDHDNASGCEETEDGGGSRRVVKKLKQMNREGLIQECEELRKTVKRVLSQVENEKGTVTKMQEQCAIAESQLAVLKEKVLQSSVGDGSAGSDLTIQTFATRKEVVAVAQDFNDDNKLVLGRVIRERVFRKHKITTKRSFENGEIQLMCHSQLGVAFLTEEMKAAHRENLVKLVNFELGQKRTKVNKKLLVEWAGKFAITVLYSDF
jgi:hypothetical protein